ncbi:recombinase family protein [Paenibacillus contaminans]|uniref:Resolvase/invertase-type recombinase catalytic domain-containing protein n=1 Tax=Paenibacillus contaminans TaxID=450362 RepID=A0A329MVN3_9BACL|nr:recombinase family protein [Paenibacillus contaminans]RAV22643.1 hypothetical protein DQG23_00030 [Paenibacillus contaminans]
MQVLALLRTKEEEQLNRQREVIAQYCELHGYTPNFQTIINIEEVDLTSINEEMILIYDCTRITRDFFKFFNFLKSAEGLSIPVVTVLEGGAININAFMNENSHFFKAAFLLQERNNQREYAKAWWTPERRAEHSLRMKEIYRKKKAQTP